jgi:hypothetical protein
MSIVRLNLDQTPIEDCNRFRAKDVPEYIQRIFQEHQAIKQFLEQ